MRHLPKLFIMSLIFFVTATGISFSESTYPTSSWQNLDSRIISTQPLRTFQTQSGVYCREFQQTIFIGERDEAAYGIACRQADGQWQIVNPDTIQERIHAAPFTQIGQRTTTDVRVYSTGARPADSYSYYASSPGHLSVNLDYVEIDRKGKYTRKYYLKNPDHRSGDNWRDRRDRNGWRDRHDRYQGKR